MRMAPACCDPRLIMEETLQYCKGLIASTKNLALVQQCFHSVLSEDEVLKHHTLQPGDFVHWKSDPKKDFLIGKAPIRYS